MTDAGGFDLSGKPELHTFREDLLRFAVLQLRDRSLAEDVVQDTLVAAMEGMRNFAGQSALKTWIFSILRHKIIDLLRRRGREISFSSLVAEGKVMDDEMDELFAANEHWTHEARPSHWGNPEEILDQQHFWAIFHACLDHLAARTARVFMRDWGTQFCLRHGRHFLLEFLCKKGIMATCCRLERHGIEDRDVVRWICARRDWIYDRSV